MKHLLVLLLILLPTRALGQDSFFPFRIDQDALQGAPDFRFLNHPLQPADRLVVMNGHFCRMGGQVAAETGVGSSIARAAGKQNSGKNGCDRVRLFGANLAFGANFPTADDAQRIARRLSKLGINLVRLHHMDSSPDSNPDNAGSILTTGPYPTLNTTAVQRLRAFLDALKGEGIYVDLNLHVGYTFRPAIDQVPPVSDLLAMPAQSKPLHIFYPRMVNLQADFARNLIEALALEDDPVLAIIEIDNETSLLQAWQTGGLYKYLLGDYQTEFQRQWNRFLKKKYQSTDALGSAWGLGDPPGPQLLSSDPQSWRLEVHAPAQGTLQILGGDPPTVGVTIQRAGAPVILKQVGFSISTERPYLAEVEVRADLPQGASRSVFWDIKQDVNPWQTLSSKTVSVTSQWQKFTMAITPAFSMDGIGRFGISVESVETPIYVRNWSLTQAAQRGLKEGETLEDATVPLVGENEVSTEPRVNDYLLFLTDRDADYLHGILGAVRAAAGDLVPVAGTQMGYGGLLNLDSHRELSYQDNHFYVDHYNFPHVQWDARDWRIRDSSSLGSGLTAFQNMAAARQADRPYTVSEFNQPWPNTHGSEIDVTLAAFGAFQDWDAIMHFAYSHSRSWDVSVPNGFNINGDWTKFPNIGQAAWLFRSGAIQSGIRAVEVPVSQTVRLQAGREKANGNISGFLATHLGYDSTTAFLHPVRLRPTADQRKVGQLRNASVSPAGLSGPFESDTGELSYDRNGQRFLIRAAQAAGVIGFLGTDKVSAGSIDVQLASSARGFASILLNALDGQDLAHSAHLLLSTPGYTLRTQPQSDPPRPQALIHYPGTADWWTLEPDPSPSKPSGDLNGGVAPTWMERVESYVTLRTSAMHLGVYPLDGSGRRLRPLGDADIERLADAFLIHLQAPGQDLSPWYELVVH